MSFQEFPWLIIGLFLRGEFGGENGPRDTPITGRSIVGLIAVLAVLVIVAVFRVNC